MRYREFSSNQQRVLIDAGQIHEAYVAASRRLQSYPLSMYWKSVSGHEYLIKALNREGAVKSLGRRTPETEQIFAEFQSGKAAAKQDFAELQSRYDEQARINSALRIARAPRIMANLLRLLDSRGLLGCNLIVIGTNALYAYEAAVGVFFDPDIMATGDMDLLWDSRSRLKLAGMEELPSSGLLGLLRKVDRSFAPVPQRGFRATNKEGYAVDLVKATPNPPWRNEPSSIASDDALVAAEIPNLKWLVSSPKFEAIVIGDDGYPARMVAPDPRAFAIYKAWLAEQKDREPIKKQRDRLQAIAVAELVREKMPHLKFDDEVLKAFPLDIVRSSMSRLR